MSASGRLPLSIITVDYCINGLSEQVVIRSDTLTIAYFTYGTSLANEWLACFQTEPELRLFLWK